MKYTIFYLLFGIGLMACSDSVEETSYCEDIVCIDEGCLFVLKNQDARISYLSCFDKWGFLYSNGEYDIALISFDLKESERIQDKEVVLCGRAKTNTCPLILPDPSIGEVYEFEIVTMESQPD